jgi:5,10-methylenetetrahydrofolate reductase
MHISAKLAQADKAGKPTFSFEFFPPKTAQVSTNKGIAEKDDELTSCHRVYKTFMTVR